MKRITVFGIALLMLLPVTSHAESYGTLYGYVQNSITYYGPGGLPNIIEVTFNTTDGLYWTLRCRRSMGNLGLCSDLRMDKYQATGLITQHGSLELFTFSTTF